ncbi:hypothetical protein JVT61DRAFT_11971 [Boletus reticuloceps]|uniref:Uncharacterized protein n=1 Tax=Boletus reticuloceps TaxID=495285 RepID=A0A8I2YEJ9_9AGAM|nr:hypothetical protein JVT61DRAFT_11971 [Boletus reticuloceps]
MPAQRRPKRKYDYSEATLNTQIPCPTCGKSFKQQGFKRHEASCRARKGTERDSAQAGSRYEQTLNNQVRALPKRKDPAVGPADAGAAPGPSTSRPGLEHAAGEIGHPFDGNEGLPGALESEYRDIPHSPGRSSNSGSAMSIVNSADDQQRPAPDQDTPDFKTEYHPRSKRPTLFQMSDEFRVREEVRLPPNPTPWHPFQCQGDFEFAEIALEASLNKGQVNALLNLISRVAKREAQVTFQNEAELRKACDSAAGGLTPAQSEAAVEAYDTNRHTGGDILKKLGLRPIVVRKIILLLMSGGIPCHALTSFTLEYILALRHSDPHLALSFDRLHSLHLGSWGKHIFGEIKKILSFLGRDAEAMVEKYVSDFPSWRELTHFNTVINITFNDGNKMRDLAKCYLELDALIGLDVHTERTLSMIESELLVFNDILKEYIKLAKKTNVPDLRVEWNFPKIHLWKHAVRDIRSKGVSRNFSTRPNESMHGALREAYDRRSNGRDVAAQILRVDQHTLAIKLLRQSIDSQNCLDNNDNNEGPESNPATLNPEADGNSTNVPNSGPEMPHCQWALGSPCKPIDMRTLETRSSTDRAFSELRRKFTAFLNSSVRGWGYEDVSYIKIPSTFEITEYRYIKVHYGSSVNWRETTDYLRYNPSFYGKARYDCALVQFTTTTVAFVRFILIFSCHIPELKGSFEFALVQPFMKKIGVSRQLDRDLNLIRVKAAPRSSPIFIPLASIVRGAVLAPDPENADEFVAFSYLDDDMFLRLKDATVSRV